MFTVIEFWTETESSAQQIMSYAKETKDEAMSSYHYVLYLAAVSSHFKHGALVIDNEGKYIARECYKHYKAEVVSDEE